MIMRFLNRREVRFILLAVSAFLLFTMGGAIVAAPLTLPLLVMIARAHSGATRICAALLAAATLAEVVWAATYTLVGEGRPWIWLLPLVTSTMLAATLAGRSNRVAAVPDV